jgi:hypothetical protein
MIVYIRQLAGLGDILFLQKAINEFVEAKYEVVWPVIEHYQYLKNYNLSDKINYISMNELSDEIRELYKSDIPIYNENYVYIPFDRAKIPNRHFDFMEAKYKLVNSDFIDWQKYINFKRFPDREKSCKEKLGLNGDEKFVFVNSLFASPPTVYKRNIFVETNFKIIEQREEHLNQFNFFDLSWILENAEEIHTVETSLCYLIECLDTTDKLFVYSRIIDNRPQYSNFDYINKFYKKDWKYIL